MLYPVNFLIPSPFDSMNRLGDWAYLLSQLYSSIVKIELKHNLSFRHFKAHRQSGSWKKHSEGGKAYKHHNTSHSLGQRHAPGLVRIVGLARQGFFIREGIEPAQVIAP